MITISEKDFNDAYAIIEEAFPISERRTYQQMKQLFQKQKYLLYGYYNEGTLLGVMMCWKCISCLFIENFAVSHKARGKGIGSILLSEIKKKYPHDIIVLEVEEPFDEMSERRIAFYKRNALLFNRYGYQQPQINVEVNEIPLRLMSYPKILLEEEFNAIKKDVFAHVYQVYEEE